MGNCRRVIRKFWNEENISERGPEKKRDPDKGNDIVGGGIVIKRNKIQNKEVTEDKEGYYIMISINSPKRLNNS